MKVWQPSLLWMAVLAAGCSTAPVKSPVAEDVAQEAAVPVVVMDPPKSKAVATAVAEPLTDVAKPPKQDKKAADEPKSNYKIYSGTGQVVKANVAPALDPMLLQGDKVSLNFEAAPLSSVAHALLGDLLQLNYTIDAGGDTPLSLRTRQPITRQQVLDVLDSVLLPHDLTIFRDGAGVYHVTKRSVTVGTRPVVGASRFKDLVGAGTVITPLNHISAAEMAKILTPVASKDALVYVDNMRNLIVLQGSKAQLAGWLELVEAFDVDFLAGMSLGVFMLEYANVSDIKEALQAMVGAEGASAAAPALAMANPATMSAAAVSSASTSSAVSAMTNPLGGLVRLFPVERLNALVVVSPRQQVIAQVETWIRRLDKPSDALEPTLFVYPIQNGSAVQVAEMLNGLFGSDGAKQNNAVAAGAAPTQLTRTGATPAATTTANGRTTTPTTSAGSTGAASNTQLGLNGTQQQQAAPLMTTTRLEGNVRVVADERRNALLIRAPKSEYRRIEQALRELDKAPVQVLIEASIVEVGLTGNLKYGFEWFLQNSLGSGHQGNALLSTSTAGTVGARPPGFSYSILNKAGVVRAALNALAEKSQVRVLSSPSVLVLDNHNATIQIGRQQPIKSATTVSSNSVVTESITYKDTGVLLSVTPSVNASGLVTMDIVQQVTDVGEIDAATGQRNFLTRQMQSKVAVRSGEPVVLGGLIRENETNGKSGVPGLSEVPLFGALFSTNSSNVDRTELLVLLTPKVLEDDDALRAASEELKQRMRSLSLQGLTGK